jgi:far upstream element-binding protein
LKKTSSGDSSRNGNFDSIDISLPANKCGLVIGKGGETIKRLSEQYGVKMVVVQQTSAVTGTDKPLRISGDPEKVAKAKEAVMQLINSQSKSAGGGHHHSTNEYGSKQHSGVNEVLIKIPGDKAGIVIGKGKALICKNNE